jgi:adenosine kinase
MLEKDNNFGCIILGCIGNDNFGKTLESELLKAGVVPLLEITDKYQTSRCAVGIFEKERCLLTDIRASNKLSIEYVIKNLDIICEANLFLIEGYFIIDKYEIVKFLLNHFAKKKIAFTLSAPFMVEKFYDKMLLISNQSNLLFCNEEEAFAFAKTKSNNYEEISLAIHTMLQPLDRLLIITCGPKPTVISKYDYIENRLDFIMMSSAYEVGSSEIVDTNGCGDSFVGGFLSQYIKGASIEKCANAGNWAASIVIRNIGCSFPQDMSIKKF